jgi:hypothetical protein
MKDERAKREAENVAVSEESPSESYKDEKSMVSNSQVGSKDENKNSEQMHRGKSLTDADIINALMQKFGINSNEACTLIMRVAENMRIAA